MPNKSFVDLKWNSVPLEGHHLPNSDFEGLIAIEECEDYNVDILNNQRSNNSSFIKEKLATRNNRKRHAEKSFEPLKNKISKIHTGSVTYNGFIVENISSQEISDDNPTQLKVKKSKDSKKKRLKKKLQEKQTKHMQVLERKRSRKKLDNAGDSKLSNKIIGLGECSTSTENIVMEDMSAWSNMGVPDVILEALSSQGFQQPTEIQRLTITPAILGRRDILGAAETGSGKTLAFGIPIVNGIMQIKQEILNGVDYEQALLKKTNIKNSTQNPSLPALDDQQESTKIIKKCQENAKKKKKSVGDKVHEKTENDYANDDENCLEESMDEEEEEGDSTDGSICSENVTNSVNNKEELTESENEVNLAENGIGCVKVIDNITPIQIKKSSALKPLYALILTPTRELAVQIKNHLVALTKFTDIHVAVVVGGMAHVKQERILSKCPEIVVATPGRLWELIQCGNDHLSQVDNIKFLAIDETDRMLERGHFEELQLLLDRINYDDKKRWARQNFVFSATLTLVHDLPDHAWRRKVTKRGKILGKKLEKMTPQKKLNKLIEMLGISNPKIVDVTATNQGKASTLLESRISCPIDYKDYYLYYVLKRHPGRTMVFCNSIGCVKRLAQLLSLLKCQPLPLHASMHQRQRLKNLERFRDNPQGLLISTDVAARGLDVPNIDHVIHYQVPRTAENYVHRSGRTARASKEGITILMIEPGEVLNYTKLCRTLGKREDLPLFPVPDALLLATKERVNLARDLDRIELRTKKTNKESGWLQKAIEEMDIIVDEDEMPFKVTRDSVPRNVLNDTRKQLNALLSKPLFPKGFSFKYPTADDIKNTHNFDFDAVKENALEVMKMALKTGLVKKLKKRSKNEMLLKMGSNKNRK